MTELELLQRARDWLMDPGHWCRGRMIDWGDGGDAFPNHPRRTCAIGAVAILGHYEPTAVREAAQDRLRAVAQDLYGCSVPHVNDNIGYAAVIALYDAAVRAAATAQPPAVAPWLAPV